jgi:hypothetical protein
MAARFQEKPANRRRNAKRRSVLMGRKEKKMEKGMFKTETFEKITAVCGVCGKEFESGFMKEELVNEIKWKSVKCFQFGLCFRGDIVFACSPGCLEKWVLEKLEEFKKEWQTPPA